MESNFNKENDPWEFSLDIDDSDLHLTPVLRSSSSIRVEPSPSTPNPIRIIPGPAGIVQLSCSTRVEPSPSTSNPVRIILGPASIVQLSSSTHVEPSLSTPNPVRIIPCLSCTIPGTIHYKVIGEGAYGKDITVGVAIILANVLVFSPKPSMHYLNITKRDVVKVFEADTTLRVNIKEFCEEYYEDILPIIMEKVRHDRRKDVHTRLDFGEGPRDRIREDSHYSNARARATEPERVNVQDRLRYETDFRDPQGRSYARALNASRDDRPKDRERFCSARESYGDSFSHSYRDGGHSHHMKRRRDKSPPFSVSSDSSDRKYQRSRRTRIPNKVKTYDGKGDPEDHVKVFQAATHVERWAMPTWCHMFNSTLIGTARGAPECMRISGFMHGVNNPELTKWLNEHVPNIMEEMVITTTAFKRGEAAAASKKKGHVSWKAQDQSKRTPKEILVAEASKFQPPPPMVTPVEKRSSNKLCDFHNNKGHSTDEYVQLKKQIEELVRAGKLSHLIKEIKQGRDQSKTGKKETAVKDKPTTIYMVQSWQRTVKQKVTQSFERVKEIAFPPLAASNGTKGPLIIEAEMGGHMIHRMYIDDTTTSLTGFSGETIWPLGKLRLVVIIGDATHSTKAWMHFMIVKSLSPYNGIIKRSGLKAIQAVPSTVHGMLKFPVEGRIVTICSTILMPTECASVITSYVVPSEEKTHPANFKVALHPDFPDQEVVIEGTLSDKGHTELCSILKKNLDIFVWQPSDMTGVPQSVAEHRLNIREGYSPVRQKKRGQAPERAKAIQAEVKKLVEAGIMREVYYHDWLSNPVMVKKHDGSWRMCVDFTDLNKACPQDCYPLPEIDWKVESLCGYPFKCFLDAYKGYHQIQLAEAGEEKTSFHTGQGVYCYTKMPFGLKNAGATYQRLIDEVFKGQIGRNIEVYVDDLVVKIYTEAEMMRDVEETFRTLRKVNMKLNPKKCSFGLAKGVFLGYVITPEGIKPWPDKTAAVLQLPSPRTIKEAEQAFQQLKQHLSELPLLVAPKPQEELIIYLSATYGAISAVLMTERGTTQTSIYFISRALQGLELNYSPMEKLVLSLVFAAKRLQRPRTPVKGQILADFLIEMSDDVSQAAPVAETQEEPWMLFTDGLSCVDGSGAGLILTSPEGVEFTYALRFQFTASNNEAEYEALVAGL
nr:reverse transcriptase domain-containing protein [Tanacetum cinerariifolium]